jgi:hypothetical protein
MISFKSLSSANYEGIWEIIYSNGMKDIIPELNTISSPDIIKCFEKRGLNVASNIVRLMIHDERIHGIPLQESIEDWSKLKKFKKYKDDVMKYLMLV